jgi:hypothetical protein
MTREKFARARLHLVEQPHILDRDHCLVGEGLKQRDLLVSERPHPPSRPCQRAPLADQSSPSDPVNLRPQLFANRFDHVYRPSQEFESAGARS